MIRGVSERSTRGAQNVEIRELSYRARKIRAKSHRIRIVKKAVLWSRAPRFATARPNNATLGCSVQSPSRAPRVCPCYGPPFPRRRRRALRARRKKGTITWAQPRAATACVSTCCRFTTYRHRFARAAPAPRAKNRGRASPVKSTWLGENIRQREPQDYAGLTNGVMTVGD